MHLWAGAYVIDISKEYEEKKEKSMNCTVVNGRLNNLYSPKDGPLRHGFTMLYKGQRAVGLYPIFEDIKEEDNYKCK